MLATRTMMMMIASAAFRRIAESCVAVPTAQGVRAVAQAVGAVGLCAGSAASLGWTDRFLRLDYPRQQQFASFEAASTSVTTTLLRSLIMPGLLEELVWRIILQPPGMPVHRVVLVNAAFAAYHVFGSAVLAERLDGRSGARAVFRDPAFLCLAFVLGNACSFVHVRSGHALWAPSLAHALPVAVWLSLLGGEEALSTAGGLPKATTRQRGDRPLLSSTDESNDEENSRRSSGELRDQ